MKPRSSIASAVILVAIVALSPAHAQSIGSFASEASLSQIPGSGGGMATTIVRTPTGSAPTTMAFGGAPLGQEVIVNGDFAAGLTGWTAIESGGGVTPGAVSALGGLAQLSEGDSFLVELKQTIVVPGDFATIEFELTLAPGFDTSSAFIPDAFEFSLLDSSLVPAAAPWSPFASSCFNVQEDGSVNLGPSATWDGTRATIVASGFAPGTVLTLYFDLIGADFDALSGVRLDNVSVTATASAGSFVRGDLNGDFAAQAADLPLLLDLLFGGASAPGDCAGFALVEVADTNDNEWLTIADHLRLNAAIAAGAPLPEPATFCALDPTTDQAGFEQTDFAYQAAAGDVTVSPPSGVIDRDVEIPVLIEAPGPISGVTLILGFNDALLTPFSPALGEGPAFESALGASTVTVEPDRIIFSVWSPTPGVAIATGVAGTLVPIGTLRFHLADFAVFPAPLWITETTSGVVTLRATIVDSSYADHHPVLAASTGEFARGDSNNDGNINIADAAYTLSYLFVFGVAPPCFDAADANNDSTINIADPVYLLEFLFTAGPPLPAPYPGCGPDSGPIDTLNCVDSAACQP
ncbi:MAG: dockerin type I repeat-containing protein [Planctomycetota bacterium]